MSEWKADADLLGQELRALRSAQSIAESLGDLSIRMRRMNGHDLADQVSAIRASFVVTISEWREGKDGR